MTSGPQLASTSLLCSFSRPDMLRTVSDAGGYLTQEEAFTQVQSRGDFADMVRELTERRTHREHYHPPPAKGATPAWIGRSTARTAA